MITARADQTATLLPNGQVLVAGGCVGNCGGPGLASAELYNPATGIFSATGSMIATRFNNDTATLLPNNQVLVAGGLSTGYTTPEPSAELYNPATGTWNPTGSMIATRYGSTAVLLPNGQVLVASGCFDNGTNPCQTVALAELYDPATGTFSATDSLITARLGNTLTLLPNGQVLVAGGNDASGSLFFASAELYNPATGSFSATGSMITARTGASATLLPDGQVLVAGGYNPSNSYLASAELYNPATGAFSATGSLITARTDASATLLLNGQVLVADGGNSSGSQASSELYDPATGIFSATGSLITASNSATLTLLPNGQVLVAGGINSSGVQASAELYTGGIGPPTSTDQCKKGGWQTFNVPRTFNNQGDCVSFVNTGK
jgi:hypothetical protein